MKKTIMILSLVLAILLLLRKFLKKKVTDFIPVDSSGEVSDASGSTFSVEDAKRIASQLYDAMKDFGTDTDTLSEVRVKIGTADNLRLVYNAFGKRDYGTFGAPMYSWLPSDSYDLKGWIIKETSGKEKKEWIKLFNLIGM